MDKNKSDQKKMNPILWIIFAIILPLIIVSVIAVFVLSFTSFDVIDWAKKKGNNVPIISSFIKSDEENELLSKLERAEDMLETQKEEIAELNLELQGMESINLQQEQEIIKLENKIKGEEELADPASTVEPSARIKQTAASFRKMDQKKAAEIIQNLERDSAITILKELSNDVRGKVLEAMEPKIAAELTERLME